ncbi:MULTISPECIES: hypothetical protein [Methylosinus]|uniref:Uncharacterized protein n=1 Tax=Methylosinus trichosporium (strain ATCC 35070 / NCIMB 11131 / UNIQEM 75 / OB3b) TaxID=595536 RepID=A0A2D2D0K8_METT3|nr:MULTISPECIES: hypothetical protein [Methylosinus]ATQ68492.1 hypothetical protein CQW49_11840 [Methylosinus trichosporium OB3b]OBS53975.1 hypothetical protein A8B73_03195 [Methylosinus sp. 3S-1]
MPLSVFGSAAASARAPLEPVPRLSPLTAESGGLKSQPQPTQAAGAAIDRLNQATASPDSDEAWDRIDSLLGQLRQLTLGGAETAAASATTTAQAISAYAEHSVAGASA